MRVTFPIVIALAMTAISQPAMAQDGGAIVAKDGECGGFIPTATGEVSDDFITSTDSIALTKGNGSSSVTCHFSIPPDLIPARTTRAEGFLCLTASGSTHDSRMQASTGGNATLTCRVSAK